MDGPVVVVVGSLNVDHTYRVARLAGPGETVVAQEVQTSFGGKGANQAIAAARAGGKVRMVGCVGDDEHGHRYRDHLEREGIDVSAVACTLDVPTGSAAISVDAAGENCIVVHSNHNRIDTNEETKKPTQPRRLLFLASPITLVVSPSEPATCQIFVSLD